MLPVILPLSTRFVQVMAKPTSPRIQGGNKIGMNDSFTRRTKADQENFPKSIASRAIQLFRVVGGWGGEDIKIRQAYQARADLLDLEGENQPLREVEEEQEDGDLAAGLGNVVVRCWQNLKNTPRPS